MVTLVGFTLQAKLVSSKHLTQVHLKISSRILENLASHLMTKYILEAQNCQSSLALKSVPQITNSIARRKKITKPLQRKTFYVGMHRYFVVHEYLREKAQRKRRHFLLYLSRMELQRDFR